MYIISVDIIKSNEHIYPVCRIIIRMDKGAKMVIYEYSTLMVMVENLEKSLAEYSKAGWDVVNVLPSIYSSANQPFTELFQVMVVLRSPIGDTGEA